MKLKVLLHKCDVFYKTARKAEDLAILKANIGNYVHFSSSDRLGINYGGSLHPGNPKAVYGFPLTAGKYKMIEENKPEAFYDYGYNKYIYIFNVNGNILDMDNLNLPELAAKMRQFVKANYGSRGGGYHTTYVPTPGPYTRAGAEFLSWVGRIAEDNFKNVHSGVNILLRGIGYDALETRNYGFGDDIASEIAVLDPSAVNLIAKVNNPMMSKEQIKEIEWYRSPEYAAQQAEKEKIRAQKDKEREELLAKYRQKIDEERALYEQERQLLREKKFDEVEALRQALQDKWKDLPPL